jgi:hypothetical protein
LFQRLEIFVLPLLLLAVATRHVTPPAFKST